MGTLTYLGFELLMHWVHIHFSSPPNSFFIKWKISWLSFLETNLNLFLHSNPLLEIEAIEFLEIQLHEKKKGPQWPSISLDSFSSHDLGIIISYQRVNHFTCRSLILHFNSFYQKIIAQNSCNFSMLHQVGWPTNWATRSMFKSLIGPLSLYLIWTIQFLRATDSMIRIVKLFMAQKR